MIEPRRGSGAVENNGLVYIVGGTNGSCSLKSTEIYYIQTNRFIIGPELNVPRANVSITLIGDYLFAVGGFDGKSFLKTIEYLNINDLNAGWSIHHKIDSNFI
jgi:influenza virus NS1A-binding protein